MNALRRVFSFMPKSKTVQIGVVGVDSGQLLVCDPCYLGSEWQAEKPGTRLNIGKVYQDIKGRKWACAMHRDDVENLFGSYEEKLKQFKGQTPNALIENGQWKELPDTNVTGEFSYRGCCQATCSEASAGQLKYKLGHAGAGVAFSSGYGDGVYPVYATYNKEGRVVKVVIDMK
jgi:Protein of unknown function (DUF4241)